MKTEGIHLLARTATEAAPWVDAMLDWLSRLGLEHVVAVRPLSHAGGGFGHQFVLGTDWIQSWTPGFDTLGLAQRMGLDTQTDTGDLEREILVAMLASPMAFTFPSFEELVSQVRMRSDIVQAARKTALAFQTEAAERPEDCWVYQEETGFTLVPGHRLVDALVKATQPEATGRLYSFSCYRATEYVILLAIARELGRSNPALLEALERDSERRAIRSGLFHDVFLTEYGSMEQPLPPLYYVPGDRLWFRNPDERSADVAGFEGSWVFYEGSGLFSNFWKRDAPFSFASKCLEIYHWRNGVREGQPGEEPVMDEDEVARRVALTMKDPAEVKRILALMQRLREPKGVYVDGGCIDTSREYPRRVRPATTGIVLPPPG